MTTFITTPNNNHSLLHAFYHAFKGLQNFFLLERNGKIKMLIGSSVVIAAFAFHIFSLEWIAILLCIGLVLAHKMKV